MSEMKRVASRPHAKPLSPVWSQQSCKYGSFFGTFFLCCAWSINCMIKLYGESKEKCCLQTCLPFYICQQLCAVDSSLDLIGRSHFKIWLCKMHCPQQETKRRGKRLAKNLTFVTQFVISPLEGLFATQGGWPNIRETSSYVNWASSNVSQRQVKQNISRSNIFSNLSSGKLMISTWGPFCHSVLASVIWHYFTSCSFLSDL
jgi:hypothetical protein